MLPDLVILYQHDASNLENTITAQVFSIPCTLVII